MNFNFFGWIRDGVRDAVLLGVSDAVDEIGAPLEGSDDSSRALLDVLRKKRGDTTDKPSLEGGKRKRLGRSLDQINAEEPVKQ